MVHAAGFEELSFLGCWSWNADTGAVYASRQLNRLFGVNGSANHVEPMSAYERRTHPDDLDWLRRERARCFGPSGHGVVEYRVIDEAGDARWVMCRGIYETDVHGDIQTAHGMMIDVTRMKADGIGVRTAPAAALTRPMQHTADMLIRAHEAAEQTGNQQLVFQIEVALATVGRVLAWELISRQRAL